VSIMRFKNFPIFAVLHYICPLYNRLSDHDAQIIWINDVYLQTQNDNMPMIRNFSKYSLYNFKMELSCETWDDVFSNNDVDAICSSFLNTYLKLSILVFH
jgi:hypothetical protein